MKLQLNARLISIGYMSLTLATDHILPYGMTLYLSQSFLEQLGVRSLPVRVIDCQPSERMFSVRCEIVGGTEDDLERISSYCDALKKRAG